MTCTTPDDSKWALFTVGNQRIALPAECVREVVPLKALAASHRGSFPLRGNMVYRGLPVPVLGARRILGLAPSTNRSSNRPFWAPKVHRVTEIAVILRRSGRTLALTVDSVHSMSDSPSGAKILHPSELAHLCAAVRVR